MSREKVRKRSGDGRMNDEMDVRSPALSRDEKSDVPTEIR